MAESLLTECDLRYLILSSTRRAPLDDLGLGRVELQSIGPHPHRHVVDARRLLLLLQLGVACRMTNTVNLRVMRAWKNDGLGNDRILRRKK